MEKIIEIDLKTEEDLYEKYNKKNISNELISYILESTPKFNKKDKIKILINTELQIESVPFIVEGLKKEYRKSLLRNEKTNLAQLSYFLFGLVILFVYTLIDNFIFREILLISGWFLIWRMVELEFLYDMNGRRKRKILKKLISSEMIEIKK